MSKRKAVGIDLGTTFSAIAHIDDYGKPQIIPNAESERITPSVILFDGGEAIVGTLAKQNSVAEPEKIVDFVKREMGKSKKEFSRDFQGKQFSAEELSALILRKLKQDAERYLGLPVTDAVITVPAYFNDAERTATVTAGQLAGLNVLRIINEPTAAALAFGVDRRDENQTVFVFDLGGGTFDVTIMEIRDGNIIVKATNGDHRLGGKDWDDVIVNALAEEFDRVHGENPLMDLQSYQELQNRAIAAKVQLSSRPRTTVVHSFNGKSIKLEWTREDFEAQTKHLVEKCKTICEIVMNEARMNWAAVDNVLLVGGMTRMPMIRSMIQQISGRSAIDNVNPDEVVALGAAIQSVLALMEEEDAKKSSAPAGSAPVESSVADTTREQFSGREGKLIQITNITSHTLGVVLYDNVKQEDYVFPMIKKATRVPVNIDNTFGTAHANMNNVTVRIVEGESTLPEECSPLGIAQIDLPPYLPAGSPVSVSYRYNSNQILEVVVEAYGNKKQIMIKRNTGLSEGEIEQATADLALINVE
jgi:molecular chaperone DnaK